MKFKVGDYISLKAKIDMLDVDGFLYCVKFGNGGYKLFMEDIENHATLIDPNTPQAGDKVWCWDDDVENAKEFYYVGKRKQSNDYPYYTESEDDYECFKHISLTDPRKKEDKQIHLITAEEANKRLEDFAELIRSCLNKDNLS